MLDFLKKILFWFYICFHSIMTRISIALYITEQEILKPSAIDSDESKKKVQRHRHRNHILEKFYAGQRDEKYMKDYYEVLKKADNFIKNSTAHKMEVAAYKYGMNFGMKDKYGRNYEHYGFFDEKHKHNGKTLGEVLELEMKERRTTDDDYELIYIFNNTPIEKGVGYIGDIVEEKEEDSFEVVDSLKKSKQFEFPIKPIRNDGTEVVNKLEQLTEFLHVKHIGMEEFQLEFFIPLKFKTNEVEEGSDVYKDILNIEGIYIDNDYGDSIWFGIKDLVKRINYNNTHEVWKFNGIEMQKM